VSTISARARLHLYVCFRNAVTPFVFSFFFFFFFFFFFLFFFFFFFFLFPVSIFGSHSLESSEGWKSGYGRGRAPHASYVVVGSARE